MECRAPGKAREVKIVGVKRTLVSGVALLLGLILLWRTRALLTLAIAVILGALLSICSGTANQVQLCGM